MTQKPRVVRISVNETTKYLVYYHEKCIPLILGSFDEVVSSPFVFGDDGKPHIKYVT